MILPRTNRSLSDRPAVDLSAVSERDHTAHAAETVLDQDAPSHLFVLAEKICLTLFDRWCEQRNVVVGISHVRLAGARQLSCGRQAAVAVSS
jgi:hypothetical protein